jgi:hypothetical protein
MLPLMTSMQFTFLPGEWAIARLPSDAPVPEWAIGPASFSAFTRTAEELSLVCPTAAVPPGIQVEPGWTVLKLHGPLAFNQTGVLAAIALPLAAAGIAIFAVSTFDTDYVLVKTTGLDSAIRVLTAAGHVRE